MAERRLRFTIPPRLIPRKMLINMELDLANGAIPFSAIEWFSLWLYIGFLGFALLSVLLNPIYGLAAFIGSLVLLFGIPKMRVNKRRNEIEEVMADALHQMAVSVRTGLVLEAVIQEIANSDYGALSEEFERILMEIKKGRPLKEALLAFGKRTGSKNLQRVMSLVIEGIEAGGPIADVLDEVSDNMRAIKMIQRERKTATSQQISFLAMASLMAGPFVMGVVGALPNIMALVAGGMSDIPLQEIASVGTALKFYVFAQAFAAGIMMGVVMYGDIRKGLKFTIPLGVIALVVFFIVQKIMPIMVKTFI